MITSLIAKFNNKHFMSLAGNGTMAVLAMLTVAMLYRALPIADIGYWVFYQTISVLLDTFRSGFLQVALIKFYTGTEPKRANEVLGSVWFLAVIITIILAGINLLFVPFMGQIQDTALLVTIQWFGITFIATLPSGIASWILQADQRFDRLLVLRIVTQGSFIICVICLIFFDQMSLQAIFIANLGSNILASAFTLFCGWTQIKTIVYKSTACIKEVYHFGKFSVGTTISANMLRSADTFIITYMLGPAAVAIYNLPGRLMEIIEIPLRSTLATAMSSLAKAFNNNNKKEVGYILQKYSGTLTLAFIPVAIGAFIFADLAISLLGGGKYVHTEAANVYRIMMIFAVFYPIDRFIAVSLDIIHQPKANFIKVILMLIGNIIGDFVGIYFLGNLYGAALATILPLLIGIFYGYYCLHKHIDFKLSGIFTLGYIQIRRIFRKNILKKTAFMIIAHLILTHNEPLQLKRLINRLAHPQAMFFVHVDLKADITSFINELNGIEKLYFIQNRVKVTWASYSMVQATLNSFTEMVKSGLPIDYINLLSAQDYPLTSAGAFYNYLEQHPEKAFMHCLDVNSDWTEAISRLTDYHLTNFEIPGKYKIQQIMNAVLPKRTIPNGMIPVGRSQWFTISYKHMLFLMHKLEQETKIANFFKLTWAPDEIIFQTLLFNSDYKVDIINDNLRYIDWSQGAKNPKILGVEDLNAILSSGKFFGRKFSASADITVLNLLDQHIGWG